MKKAEPHTNSFLTLLNERHQWPCIFVFKFIVPESSRKSLEAKLPKNEKMEIRPSRAGKYFSYTLHCAVSSGEEVIEIYTQVQEIPGLVSL